jgi:DNA invertase Pin-like site-specific DNA recombinase
MKKTAFIYCRVSTDKQETERQLRELTNYCEVQGYEIVGTLQESISATKSVKSREHLIQLVKASKASYFIAQDISRFSRNTKVGIELKDRLHQLKVCLVFIQTGLKSLDDDGTENDTARLLFNMLLSVYEMENSTKIKMIKNGLTNAVLNGKVLGRKVGYKENLILKYPKIVKELKTNSIRRTARLCDVHTSLVQRVKLQIELDT